MELSTNTSDLPCEVGGDRGLLAVVGGQKEQESELVACFARQGERVGVVRYPDARQLLAENPRPRFGAVVFFASGDQDASDAEEIALRSALPAIPLYRL